MGENNSIGNSNNKGDSIPIAVLVLNIIMATLDQQRVLVINMAMTDDAKSNINNNSNCNSDESNDSNCNSNGTKNKRCNNYN